MFSTVTFVLFEFCAHFLNSVPSAHYGCFLQFIRQRMKFRYFKKDFQMVPVAPVTTGISFVIKSYLDCIYVARSLYFKIIQTYFFIAFISAILGIYVKS
jgi:hypothetical protein